MGQRIKGQEVELVLMIDGAPQSSLQAAKSIEINFKTELLQEGYLGETTDRYDTIFKGVGGRLEFNYDSPEIFNVIRAIINKARRREAGTRINGKATLNFPSGRKARVVLRDMEFGPMPVNFGSRADYGAFSLEYGCSEAQILPI